MVSLNFRPYGGPEVGGETRQAKTNSPIFSKGWKMNILFFGDIFRGELLFHQSVLVWYGSFLLCICFGQNIEASKWWLVKTSNRSDRKPTYSNDLWGDTVDNHINKLAQFENTC